MREVICEYCNKSFMKREKDIRRSKHNYCCRQCSNAGRSLRLKNERKEFIEHCTGCGIEVYRSPSNRLGQPFCSRACHTATQNPITNKTRMTMEVRTKLRKARLGKGEGKTYTKIYGRHEHRVVAEQILGRALLPGEVVHHIDRDKRNNHPSNLKIFASQKDHAKWHKEHDGKEVVAI